MKHEAFLNDATGAAPDWSARAKYHALSAMLTDIGQPITPQGVENWFARSSIPMKWIFQIQKAAALKGRVIDLNAYA